MWHACPWSCSRLWLHGGGGGGGGVELHGSRVVVLLSQHQMGTVQCDVWHKFTIIRKVRGKGGWLVWALANGSFCYWNADTKSNMSMQFENDHLPLVRIRFYLWFNQKLKKTTRDTLPQHTSRPHPHPSTHTHAKSSSVHPTPPAVPLFFS